MDGKNILGLIIALIIAIGVVFVFANDYKNQKEDLDSSTQSVKVTYTSHLGRTKSGSGDYSRSSTTRMYTPIYHYIVDGTKYTCKSGHSSSFKPSNEPKTVYYNSQNPQDCMVDDGLMNVFSSLTK